MRSLAFVLSLLFIFVIPWEGVVRLPGLGTAARLTGFGVAGFWILTVLVTGKVRKPAPFQLAVSLFVAWNALSIFWSANPTRTLSQLITWAQLLILIYILWDLYTTRTAILLGLQAFIFGEYVAVGSAIANFFSGNVYYTNYERFSPGETNPDGFGFMLALAIPVAWYLASAPDLPKYKRLLRLINYTYIPAAFLGLALSGTRTAMLASVVGMAFGLASLNRLRPITRLVIFAVLSTAILLLLPQVQDLTSFQRLGTTASSLATGDLNQRTQIWEDGLVAFAERPLVGVGGNMYRSINSLGKVAHNSFLSVLVELGIVGFTLFGTILTIAVWQAIQQPKWEASFWLTMLAVWCIGALSLTYEHRKATWLILSLIVASSSLVATAGASRRREHLQEPVLQTAVNSIASAHGAASRTTPL